MAERRIEQGSETRGREPDGERVRGDGGESTKYKVQSAKHEEQSSKLKAQSSKHVVQSSKLKAQSSKHEVQSSKLKAQSSKQEVRSVGHKVEGRGGGKRTGRMSWVGGRLHYSAQSGRVVAPGTRGRKHKVQSSKYKEEQGGGARGGVRRAPRSVKAPTSVARNRVARNAFARGALLLEVMLAITLFVMGAIAILALLNDSTSGLASTRDAVRAADLARSAMARIEAGIGSVRTEHGPVPLWEDDLEAHDDLSGTSEIGEGFADTPPRPSLWRIEVESEPTDFDGLTRVTVRAIKQAAPNSTTVTASYTLHQLVRMADRVEDTAGAVDEISRAAESGAARPSGGGR